jgi:hypothetical protein
LVANQSVLNKGGIYRMSIKLDPWESFSFYEEDKANLCFDDPALRYLSDEQAKEWLRFSEFDNIHTLSNEIKIIEENLHILLRSQENLVLVDLGCGDGIKSTQVFCLLRDHGVNISAYHAVDINQVFIDTTKRLICELGGMSPDRFFGHCTKIEDLSLLNSLPWSINSHSNERILYLFLGNTYNNFAPRKCQIFIDKLLRPRHQILIGAKVRINFSENEFANLIREYEAFGNTFTFSFGHLLGLADNEMARDVCYNYSMNCVEIWLHLTKPLTPPGFPEVKSRKLLVFRSFRPTKRELINELQDIGLVKLWEAKNGNDVVLHCIRQFKEG